MSELAFIIDSLTGAVLVEGPERVPPEILECVEDALGPGSAIACAAPPALHVLAAASPEEVAGGPCVRIAGYYHNSLIEGPGRRSTVKFQGCPLHCVGCIAESSWELSAGSLVPVDRLATLLLDPAYHRDGISIVGGEPFYQPDGLLALIQALRARECSHIVCYSGYTYERLRRMARRQPAIDAVLQEIDMLLDGPYVQRLADGAGPWVGSTNQRVLMLRAGTPTGVDSGKRSP